MTSFLGFIIPGGWELWIILAIFLLLFGHRIPGMARAMGSGVVEFKKGLKGEPKTEGSDGDKSDEGGSDKSKPDQGSDG